MAIIAQNSESHFGVQIPSYSIIEALPNHGSEPSLLEFMLMLHHRSPQLSAEFLPGITVTFQTFHGRLEVEPRDCHKGGKVGLMWKNAGFRLILKY